MGSDRLGGIVLTGGSGARLGGVDKAAIVLGGRTLLDRILEALEGVPDVAVVGEARPTGRTVSWTREEPAGSGPAAGLLAGLEQISSEWVVVLAVDLPFVTAGTVHRLLSGVAADGALLVDDRGRRQFLCGVYRRPALLAAAPVRSAGLSMRSLLEPLALAEIPAQDDEALDIDTDEQLEQLRARFDQ